MSLLEMSVSAAMMISVILLIQAMGKKYISKSVIMRLWNLVLIRALLPVQIPIGDIPVFRQEPDSLQVSKMPGDIPEISGELEGLRGITQETINTDMISKLEAYAVQIWIIGMICISAYMIWIYIREHRELKKCISTQNETAERLIRNQSLYRRIRLYESKTFCTPVTYGVLRPKIVLPENLSSVSRVDIRNMTAHELVHIQRYDVAKRFFMATALCIHWFNPLIWVMYHRYGADQEMACDEKVLKDMTGEGARNYVYTMIKMASGRKMLWSTSGFVGKSAEKKRILAAMNQRSMGKGSILAVTVLGLCLAWQFFSFTQNRNMPEIQGEKEAPRWERQEMVQEEKILLSPFYEGEIRAPDIKTIDYEAVMEDIRENYNDPSQPLTDEQAYAIDVKNYILMAKIFKRRQDRGEKLDATEIWVLDEFYKYNE